MAKKTKASEKASAPKKSNSPRKVKDTKRAKGLDESRIAKNTKAAAKIPAPAASEEAVAAATPAGGDAHLVAESLLGLGVKPPKKPLKDIGYPNLALCVVDAVFTRQARFGSASGAVCSLQTYWERKGGKPSITSRRLKLGEFVTALDRRAESTLVDKVFMSDQRALGIPSLTRAAVAVDFARNLHQNGIETKKDLCNPNRLPDVLAAAKATRGVGAAALAHLRLVSGCDAAEQPPRWTVDFIGTVTGRNVEPAEAAELLESALSDLRKHAPKLTRADLEHAIWAHVFGFKKA
ncbi:MAG: hypothetical protein EG823_04135 [Actinobacteria bacterium]|nr:hypothetical protein [Actinomycetota bacterium]